MQVNKAVLLRFLRDDSGVSAVEYGLLLAMIALGCIAAYSLVGQSLVSALGTDEGGVANELAKAANN